MIRSALLGIGGTRSCRAAQAVAFDLAARMRIRLSAIDIIDMDRLLSREPVPIGALHIKAEKDRSRLMQAAAQWEAERKRFVADAKAARIAADVAMASGDAGLELLRAAPFFDLMVLGQDSSHAGEVADGVSGVFVRLLQRSPRPVLLCPAHARPVSAIVIAYDGSPASARALQLFVLLGMARLGKVSVVSIAAERPEGEQAAEQAARYLRSHGIDTAGRAITTGHHPAEAICDVVGHDDADLVVMGAYGHRGWREALFGSTTTRLLQRGPSSLFIHH